MKSKKMFAFLTVALTLGMVLAACNSGGGSSLPAGSSDTSEDVSSQPSQISSIPSSSSEVSSASSVPSSSSQISGKLTVNFVVDGQVIQTNQVDAGEVVDYEGATPTKTSTVPMHAFRFKGWDRNLTLPITENTTINAIFEETVYVNELMIDDFESYRSTGRMKEAGWQAMGYSNATGKWSTETQAAVSLASNSVEGEKALRFNSWENGVGYKFVKVVPEGAYTNSVNALRFRLMVPAINTVKVLLKGQITIAGKLQEPSFSYTFHPESNEYVEYTIPLADDGWALWDDPEKTIKTVADWTGVHEDDYVKYLTSIDFFVQGSDGKNGRPYIAFLDSIKFVTLDNPQNTVTEIRGDYDRYTATLTSGHIMRLDIGENGNATASIIDKEVPEQVQGTIAYGEDRAVTFTSSDGGATLKYVGKVTDAGKTFKFVSATGSLASEVDEINLTAVQVVDNFEQYTEDGKAYYQNGALEDRSGCRGAYYSEYYNQNAGPEVSSPWGGAKWSLMGGDGDQLKLVTDANGAHSGKQYVSLKNSNQFGMRYMQWGLFDGTSEKNSFRGSRMGFWAKTNGVVKNFTAFMYYQTSPTNETRNSYVSKDSFVESEAISEWTHYEIELNPEVTYYGYMIFIDANWASNSYLFVDDVEVYNANPYAKYEAPVVEVFKLPINQAYTSKINGLLGTQLRFTSATDFRFYAIGINKTLAGNYVLDDHELTLTADNTTCVATADEEGKHLTFTSVTGDDILAQGTNGATFTLADYADNAETYDESGTMYYQGNQNPNKVKGARGAYYCEYAYAGSSTEVGGNGWILMGGSGDQLQLATSGGACEGTKYLKMKASTAGDMRYFQWNLYKGDGEGHTGIERFSIALSNNNSINVEAKVMVFKVPKLTPDTLIEDNYEAIDITLNAGSPWNQYDIELNPNETYYGYGIWFKKTTGSAAFIDVDNAYYAPLGNDPFFEYYTKSGLTLSAKINNGAMDASFTFGEYGSGVFNCADLNMNNTPMTFKMYKVGVSHRIEITIGETLITGNYSVTENFQAKFAVGLCSGPLSEYFASYSDIFMTE